LADAKSIGICPGGIRDDERCPTCHRRGFGDDAIGASDPMRLRICETAANWTEKRQGPSGTQRQSQPSPMNCRFIVLASIAYLDLEP
jgi:hypothetical protein